MPSCKKCGFVTDDIEAFVRHIIDEKEPTETPKKGHKTVEEFLNCPECFPKFEEAFLARGYVKKEKKPEREPFPF